MLLLHVTWGKRILTITLTVLLVSSDWGILASRWNLRWHNKEKKKSWPLYFQIDIKGTRMTHRGQYYQTGYHRPSRFMDLFIKNHVLMLLSHVLPCIVKLVVSIAIWIYVCFQRALLKIAGAAHFGFTKCLICAAQSVRCFWSCWGWTVDVCCGEISPAWLLPHILWL